MTTEKKDRAASPRDRKARLAAELRANLLKRKVQARQRKAGEKTACSPEKEE